MRASARRCDGTLLLGEQTMDELNGGCAFTNRRRDALDGPVTHLTYCEDARHARLQCERVPLERPRITDVFTRQQESALVLRELGR